MERETLVALIAGNMAAASIQKGEPWEYSSCVAHAIEILRETERQISLPEPEPDGEIL